MLEPYRVLRESPRPRAGWLRAVRNALGMTTRQLAARLGMSHGNIAKAEKAEARKTITLETLSEIARGLDCELVCALVPKEPLRDTIEQQALKTSSKQLERGGHHMALEDQAVSKKAMEEMIEQRQVELLSGRWSKLWE